MIECDYPIEDEFLRLLTAPSTDLFLEGASHIFADELLNVFPAYTLKAIQTPRWSAHHIYAFKTGKMIDVTGVRTEENGLSRFTEAKIVKIDRALLFCQIPYKPQTDAEIREARASGYTDAQIKEFDEENKRYSATRNQWHNYIHPEFVRAVRAIAVDLIQSNIEFYRTT